MIKLLLLSIPNPKSQIKKINRLFQCMHKNIFSKFENSSQNTQQCMGWKVFNPF